MLTSVGLIVHVNQHFIASHAEFMARPWSKLERTLKIHSFVLHLYIEALYTGDYSDHSRRHKSTSE